MTSDHESEIAPPGPPPSGPGAEDTARNLRVEFHGSAREYFRIWAVNLCLTMLTLGIFSAWAKVRKKRYFYAHTRLDGTPFQYLGQPIPILKGRIIAAAFLSFYYVSTHFVNSLLPVVIIIALLLAPWMIVRSAAFNARYSAFRNMTFAFDGNYLGAIKVLYLTWLPVFVLVGGGLWVARTTPAIAVVVVLLAMGFFPFWIARVKRFIVDHTAFGGINGQLSARGLQFLKIYLMAGLFMILASVVLGVVVFGLSRSAPTLVGTTSAVVFVALPFYFAYVLMYAYVHARSTNLVWNRSRLGPVQFRSTLTGRGLSGLYISNALAIIASLGLLIPWAVIRTMKYRADRLTVRTDGELGVFRGTAGTDVRAAGAEVAEFFDVDLSL